MKRGTRRIIRDNDARLRRILRVRDARRQRLAREPEALHLERLAFLAQLSGKLACEHGFTPDELLEAEAALRVPPCARQAALPLVVRPT